MAYWQVSQAQRESEQKLKKATAKARQRAIGGLSSLDGKSLTQRINEEKRTGAACAALIDSHRDSWTEISEEDRWCVTREELRNMSQEQREEFDAAEKRRAAKRAEQEERDFAACHGKYSWICSQCQTVNPACVHLCRGSERVKGEDGFVRYKTCGAVQGENFGGLAVRASVSMDTKMTWTKYDIKDRTKYSGTRLSRVRAKAFRALEKCDTDDGEEVRRKGFKAVETCKKAKRNQRANRAEKILAATMADEHKWPCLRCPLVRDAQEKRHTGDPLSDEPLNEQMSSVWNLRYARNCYKCAAPRRVLDRDYGGKYWKCIPCNNPLIALSMRCQLCPDCKTDWKQSEEIAFEVFDMIAPESSSSVGAPTLSSVSTASFSSAASSMTASSAGEVSDVKRRHKKRGGGQTKKPGAHQWNASHGNCQEGSGCAFLNRSRPRETESEDEGGPTRRPRQTSAAGTAGLAVFGLTMVAQIGTADSAEVTTIAARTGGVLIVAIFLSAVTTVNRGTDAVGELVDHTREAASSLVNVTKEAAATVVEEIGEESKGLFPASSALSPCWCW